MWWRQWHVSAALVPPCHQCKTNTQAKFTLIIPHHDCPCRTHAHPHTRTHTQTVLSAPHNAAISVQSPSPAPGLSEGKNRRVQTFPSTVHMTGLGTHLLFGRYTRTATRPTSPDSPPPSSCTLRWFPFLRLTSLGKCVESTDIGLGAPLVLLSSQCLHIIRCYLLLSLCLDVLSLLL